MQTQYSYGPFGATTASGSASGNVFQFTGREDDGTGLYYYRTRYYNPTLQRFISEDPAGFRGGDVNFYAYTGNSPLDYIDPSGLTRKDPTCGPGNYCDPFTPPPPFGPGSPVGPGSPPPDNPCQAAHARHERWKARAEELHHAIPYVMVAGAVVGGIAGAVIGAPAVAGGGPVVGALLGAHVGMWTFVEWTDDIAIGMDVIADWPGPASCVE